MPDQRFNWLCKKYEPVSVMPPVLTVTDIAGLVKGASEGAGLGNAFLSHIQAVDAVYHMVRGFDDKDVTHVEGNVDPIRDIGIIEDELRLKDINSIGKTIDSLKRGIANKLGGKEKLMEYESLLKVQAWLKDGNDISNGTWGKIDVRTIINLMTLIFI